MSLSEKEIEQLLNQLDTGDDTNVPDELIKEHQLIKKGVVYIEEESFRVKLNKAHKSMKGLSFLNSRFYLTTGIAASVLLALFWYTSMNPGSESIELQMEEAPAYADSASFDSINNSYPEVDKFEE